MSSFRGNLQHVADEQTVQMLNSAGRGSTVRASHLAKAENLVCHPDTQNLQANSCSLFEVLGVSSNAELRLRQPPGRTTLGTKVLPAFRSDLDPQKVFTDHLRPKCLCLNFSFPSKIFSLPSPNFLLWFGFEC